MENPHSRLFSTTRLVSSVGLQGGSAPPAGHPRKRTYNSHLLTSSLTQTLRGWQIKTGDLVRSKEHTGHDASTNKHADVGIPTQWRSISNISILTPHEWLVGTLPNSVCTHVVHDKEIKEWPLQSFGRREADNHEMKIKLKNVELITCKDHLLLQETAPPAAAHRSLQVRRRI